MREKKVLHKTMIGGQAVIEGVMMRGLEYSALAVRLPNGTVDLEKWKIKNGKNKPWYRKVPIIRGCCNFVTSMAEGYKCLSKSAEKATNLEDEEEEMSKFEKWLTDKLGDKLMGIITTISMFLGIALAVLLFVYLPTWIVSLFGNVGPFKALLEGIIKIAILILYLWLTSKMKDMKRTYEYHGAEHKTIACYEAGEELTVENVKRQRRFHPRCGTSFIFLVLIVGIVIFSFLFSSVDNTWLRMALRLLTLPLIVGVSYELIKIAGRYDNIVTRIISAPGMALQRITTNEPDDSEIEVAIAAFKAVAPEEDEDDRW
ncbi:MAG: DUF1385 domain-containing protein [Oscillospiraceae bacterium]